MTALIETKQLLRTHDNEDNSADTLSRALNFLRSSSRSSAFSDLVDMMDPHRLFVAAIRQEMMGRRKKRRTRRRTRRGPLYITRG